MLFENLINNLRKLVLMIFLSYKIKLPYMFLISLRLLVILRQDTMYYSKMDLEYKVLPYG